LPVCRAPRQIVNRNFPEGRIFTEMVSFSTSRPLTIGVSIRVCWVSGLVLRGLIPSDSRERTTEQPTPEQTYTRDDQANDE